MNLGSSAIFCLCSGEIYLFVAISFSSLFLIVSGLFSGEPFEAFIILLAVLLPIKSLVASAVFWITLFEVILSA